MMKQNLSPILSRACRSRATPSLSLAHRQLPLHHPYPHYQHQLVCLAHTVRVIVQQDLPNGKAYSGEVIHVKAGYARNFLLPQKMVLYAKRQNFERLGMKDPDHETPEERRLRLEREAMEGSDNDLKAANVLRSYLRNKTLRIWRNIDPVTNAVSPGMVDAKAVRKKLSKQLKIDLEPHEKVHLFPEMVPSLSDLKEDDVQALLLRDNAFGEVDKPCTVQIRQLGECLARIALSGGHMVPLKLEIVKR